MPGLQAIRYTRGRLEVLNQLRLPHEFVYDEVSTCDEAFDCIRSMRVRGAPAIAIVAALALAVELENKCFDESTTVDSQLNYITTKLDYLQGSRPTAVDLSNAIRVLKIAINDAAFGDAKGLDSNGIEPSRGTAADAPGVRNAYIVAAETILEDDLTTNLAIGRYGAEYLRRQQMPLLERLEEDEEDDEELYFTTNKQGAQDSAWRKPSVITHCNTGSLATSGHGTALGIIRSLHMMNYLDHAYCTETRPYNQGSRLTAFELVYEKIPSTLITDSMAGALFARLKEEKKNAVVIVGADRVARNGDTANKIGTYSLAVLARAHHIKFIVAAPTTSIDLETETGANIKIENRSKDELTQISGAVVDKNGKVDVKHTERVAIAHQEINVWNPAFDITPHTFIDAIITEKGEVVRSARGTFNFSSIMPERWMQQVEAPTGSLQAVSTMISSSDSEDGILFKMELA